MAVEKTEALPDGSTVYRMAENMAGWARIRFTGLKKGDVVTIRYDERDPHGPKRHIDMFCRSLPSTNACPELSSEMVGFQTDRFISAGGAVEYYEPRFTWNGFRYVTVKGAAPAAAVWSRRCTRWTTRSTSASSVRGLSSASSARRDCSWVEVGCLVGLPNGNVLA